MARKPKQKKQVEALTHEEAKRRNIPTAEYQSVVDEQTRQQKEVRYPRGGGGLEEEKENRNRDLDPQLVWRGKDEQDWSDLVVHAPPLYIQEKVHPKVLIDDLVRQSSHLSPSGGEGMQLDLFADFNGIPDEAARTEFYQHEANWTNRLILGDSLQVMASLAEREGLRGKVQCIYLDPPYGIKFNSNFQWSTTSRDVKDGKAEHITREPEQVKAFRDTWRDGIHSYLTYLRDRLTVCRDLLTDSGSIFVQIGDENVHRVRALMDEILGEENFVSLISYATTSGFDASALSRSGDYIIWYCKAREKLKYRPLFFRKNFESLKSDDYKYVEQPNLIRLPLSAVSEGEPGFRIFRYDNMVGQGSSSEPQTFTYCGRSFDPPKSAHWKANYPDGINRLGMANRIHARPGSLAYIRYMDDFGVMTYSTTWIDTSLAGSKDGKVYVVETNPKVIERCMLMVTDPGDLVLDPTCGSGTTAYVAEQWGRRWITIDTSRVALALARARIMGARYPYYLLADSPEGQQKEAEITRSTPSSQPTHGDIRHGFVYQRVPHITLKAIANNAEIDVIWERFEEKLLPLREQLTEVIAAIDPDWLENFRATQHYDVELPDAIQEWEVPREPGFPWPEKAAKALEKLHAADTVKKKLTQLKTINRELGRNYTLDSVPQKPFDLWEEPRMGTNKHECEDKIGVHSRSLVVQLHQKIWQLRIERQKEIDASIAAKADFEYLYDKPYEDKGTVRVAGPFTVESLSPHRVLAVDENDELIEVAEEGRGAYGEEIGFTEMILDNLRTAGVQQAHKEDRIVFTSLVPWPGDLICAEGRYTLTPGSAPASGRGENEPSPPGGGRVQGEGGAEMRAAIFIGPEFGTVTRPDLVAAAREAGDAGFDVLIACAFNYDAHSTDFNKLGRLPVLKARMNADLHMATDLKNTGKGNLFVIFGEPDIIVASEAWLVDSNGNRVAPYDIFAIVSGVESLAEINGLERKRLQSYAKLSNRREIWDHLTNEACSNFNSGKYRGGAGKKLDGGVSTVAWHCAGVSGGAGNLRNLVAKTRLLERGEFHVLVERLRRDKQDAARSDEIAIHQPLSTIHYAQVRVHGVDVFHPQTGEVRSDGPEGIACWFLDTDYNEESFFVRQAYFLGANDPYKALKTTLKAEIDADAWATLHSDTSRPFPKPQTGRIAVKVINHLGDEVMKVFRV